MNCINHPDRPRIAFCQNCGKPLCAECARVVGSAVFDEQCLAERLAASTPGASAYGGASPYGSGPTGYSTQYEPGPGGATRWTVDGTVEGIPYTRQGVIPPPGAPNPGLALLLGFIPGVGAMYNGQYAKGVVHLVVFAVLVSLADQHGVFGLFIAGWVFYQVFEAFHTAKARRDGTPLPNPFGLNDLGERLGFGRAWGAVPPVGTGPAPAASAPPGPGASATADPYRTAGMPESAAASGQQPYAASAGYPYGNPYASASAGPTPSTAGPGWGAPAESYAAYAPVPPFTPGPLPAGTNRFPVGAMVLIGLGLLFLIGNAGWIEGFPVYRLFPFLLIGLAIWLFSRRMLETGVGLSDDGTPGYQLRLLRALRGSMWIFVVGILSFLDSFHILSWGRSWPLFIIAAGVFAFLQRSAFASAAQAAYAAPMSPVPASAPAPEPVSASNAIVPAESSRRDGEEV